MSARFCHPRKLLSRQSRECFGRHDTISSRMDTRFRYLVYRLWHCICNDYTIGHLMLQGAGRFLLHCTWQAPKMLPIMMISSISVLELLPYQTSYVSGSIRHPVPCGSCYQHCLSVYSIFFLGLMTVVRSKTGRLGSGSSMVSMIIPKNRYHPSMSAAKKPAPVPTRHVVAISVLPSAV